MTVAETARPAIALGVESRSILPDGMVALFGAGASMLVCYNKFLLAILFGLLTVYYLLIFMPSKVIFFYLEGKCSIS